MRSWNYELSSTTVNSLQVNE